MSSDNSNMKCYCRCFLFFPSYINDVPTVQPLTFLLKFLPSKPPNIIITYKKAILASKNFEDKMWQFQATIGAEAR